MKESSQSQRLVTGIDLGDAKVRVVVGAYTEDGELAIAGYGEEATSGMRKGDISVLEGPAKALRDALVKAEAMSGYKIESASVNVNGRSIASTEVRGRIGLVSSEIDDTAIYRVNENAKLGKIPANMEMLDLIPYDYAINDNWGVRNPRGMQGSSLDVKAHIITALKQNCDNIRKVCAASEIAIEKLVFGSIAASKVILDEKQIEDGVVMLDFGESTTGVTIFEEGILRYASVVPLGSNTITKSLAVGLTTDMEIAEEIKLRYATGAFDASDKDITIKSGREEHIFKRADVDEMTRTALEYIFGEVAKRISKSGYANKLPAGAVLIGGGAQLRDIDVFVRESLGMATKLGKITPMGGMFNSVSRPEWAVALGLMLSSTEAQEIVPIKAHKKGLFGRLKSFFSPAA